MIILIGGVSCTGKTKMAQRLLETYKIPYLSVDHVKMGLYRGTGNKKYHPETEYKTLSENLWPILKGIIETNIENGQHIIIEGCYLLPHLVKQLDVYKNEILFVSIGFSEGYIRKFYDTGIKKHCGVIEKRDENV